MFHQKLLINSVLIMVNGQGYLLLEILKQVPVCKT